MTSLLLTIHFLVAVAMIGVILLQRSEGGALGLGGGGGMGGLMSGRGAANALSRTTVILAAIFIATSISLALLAKAQRSGGNSILAPTPTSGAPAIPGAPPGGSLLPETGPAEPAASAPPASGTPAPAASAPAAPSANQPAAPAPSSTPAPAPAAPSTAPAGTPPATPPN